MRWSIYTSQMMMTPVCSTRRTLQWAQNLPAKILETQKMKIKIFKRNLLFFPMSHVSCSCFIITWIINYQCLVVARWYLDTCIWSVGLGRRVTIMTCYVPFAMQLKLFCCCTICPHCLSWNNFIKSKWYFIFIRNIFIDVSKIWIKLIEMEHVVFSIVYLYFEL